MTAKCERCNGTGRVLFSEENRVTHEMALDCEEPEMEGQLISMLEWEDECPDCKGTGETNE